MDEVTVYLTSQNGQVMEARITERPDIGMVNVNGRWVFTGNDPVFLDKLKLSMANHVPLEMSLWLK